jgi:hypothetical protein
MFDDGRGSPDDGGGKEVPILIQFNQLKQGCAGSQSREISRLGGE